MVIPLFEMKISKQPIAIIKSGDRQLQFVKVSKHSSKYFTTKDGKILVTAGPSEAERIQ